MVTIRPITPEEHRRFVDTLGAASFLQMPSWGQVKTDWRAQSVGWFDGPDPTADGSGGDAGPFGVGLILYRSIPSLHRSLAYLPEGPVMDWARLDVDSLTRALTALVAHTRAEGAFGVRLGPPVVSRVWSAATVKAGLAAPEVRRLGDLPPDEVGPHAAMVTQALRRAGFRPPTGSDGFATGQPRYVFWLPLKGRSEQDLLAGFNQLWRRSIRKAERAGVTVSEAGVEGLPTFHACYVQTAHRDGFTPRPLSYFQRMLTALSAEDPRRIRLYLAHHGGELVAATLMVQVGDHAWYSYGASSTAHRDIPGSYALQWRMMRDAAAAGATVYDLRGITDTLDTSDHLVGLLQFKVGTGGQAVEYVGEWDRPINRALHAAVAGYLRRRS